MRVTYASPKVEKYFSDFNKLKKALPVDWVRAIKKHLNNLEAADCFGDFLKLGLGRPEQLTNPILVESIRKRTIDNRTKCYTRYYNDL